MHSLPVALTLLSSAAVPGILVSAGVPVLEGRATFMAGPCGVAPASGPPCQNAAAPAAGIPLKVVDPATRLVVATTVTDAYGTFRVVLASGAYTLELGNVGPHLRWHGKAFTVTNGSTAQLNVEIELLRP
jgi:hypothetical protein